MNSSSSWRWPETWAILWLAAIIGLTVTSWDYGVTCAVYDAGGGSWAVGEMPVWMFFYSVGVYPALALGLVSLFVFIFSFDVLALRRYRKAAGYILANLALGPLILINVIFKGMCGRPRPTQVIEFGGTLPFEKLFQLNLETFGKSMGCGHASMGFVFFALVFLVASQRWRWGIGIFAFSFGMLIGVARVAQGGHFASDVVLAGMVCWGIAWGMAKVMRLEDGIWLEVPANSLRPCRVSCIKRFAMTCGIFLVAACFVGLATPRNKSGRTHVTPDQGVLALELQGTLYLTGRNDGKTRLRSELNGFGSPKSTIRVEAAEGIARHRFIGIFSEKNVASWLELSEDNSALSEIRLCPNLEMIVVRDQFDLDFPLQILHSADTEVRIEVDSPNLVFVQAEES